MYFTESCGNRTYFQGLKAVETSISYIDKITADSIPTLPVGTCIFNGISTQMPVLLAIDKLECNLSPQSETVCISELLSNDSSLGTITE
ncbi:MAG: hypothetical protein PHX18_09110 [Candidatus Gastranaerophilales bacterium]|nr:hypothetical protein [Candidatus Gastranaerophilales bacterium]